MAARFIAEGHDVNTLDQGTALLYTAAEKNHLDVVVLFLAEGADVNQGDTDNVAFPLWTASKNGHLDVAKFLVSKGADVNQATSDTGASPLLIAAQNRHPDVAEFLVAKGADVKQARTDTGSSPLYTLPIRDTSSWLHFWWPTARMWINRTTASKRRCTCPPLMATSMLPSQVFGRCQRQHQQPIELGHASEAGH